MKFLQFQNYLQKVDERPSSRAHELGSQDAKDTFFQMV